MDNAMDLKSLVRDVPDFPKKGIIFKDVTTLLSRGDAFRHIIDQLAAKYSRAGITKIVCIESRGFIFGSALAYAIGAGVVPVRKKGKLPAATVSTTYQLEYGTDSLEMHHDAIMPGEKVLILDDLLATGGTAAAAIELAQKLKAEIVGLAFIIELGFLNGRKNALLNKLDIFSVITY